MRDRIIDVAIFGATGYVAGELLRLLAGHPVLRVAAAVSRSSAGTKIEDTFPHLRGVFPDMKFCTEDDVKPFLKEPGPLAVFSCLPHGESAPRMDRLIADAAAMRKEIRIVDLSADFRIADPKDYEAVYGKPHAAPARLAEFTCALPDLTRTVHQGMIAHPGCFTTAVTLGCSPLHALHMVEPRFFVSAVTGSTGSGREPTATTHHPERHGNLRAYSPLKHRHEIEMRTLVGQQGKGPVEVLFVPHSGSFARGIHATIHARLLRPISTAELVERIAGFYQHTPFVSVTAAPPTLKEVVGTNRCRLGVETRGHDVVLFSVIDNLTKGASGGGLQWMNRLLALEEDLGLVLPGLGWN